MESVKNLRREMHRMDEDLSELVGWKDGVLRGVAPARHRAHITLHHLSTAYFIFYLMYKT